VPADDPLQQIDEGTGSMMIVIGTDAHKRSHALAAVDAGAGVVVAELEFKTNEDGHRRCCGGRAG
jgi:hypothetical protein